MEHHGRIIQDGIPVAGTMAQTKEAMLRELLHYATLYSQEGSIIMETRTAKGQWKRHNP